MEINAIITDLDDTLLNEQGKISELTLKAVAECLERGIRVIPASGRAQASMEPYVRQMNTGLPYIACNGAQLVNADHSIMESILLSAEISREVCAYLQAHGCYVQAYREDYVYYAEECEYSVAYKRSSGLKGEAVGDLLQFITFESPKLLCISEPEKIAWIYPQIQAHFAGRAAFTISKPFYLEVEPLGANKGAALARLSEKIDLEPAKTLVFGDSLNDMAMLAFTENSVAMGNARDEVKAAARYVCHTNGEDGVARFIREHLLH